MTFTVRPGQGTGFVGPNSAGKSTTKCVAVGLDAPGTGTATIGGQPYRTQENPLRHAGTLLDARALQPSRSARNQLPWLARSRGRGEQPAAHPVAGPRRRRPLHRRRLLLGAFALKSRDA